MKVTNHVANNVQNAEAAKAKRTDQAARGGKASESKGPQGGLSASAEISSKAREFANAKKIAEAAPSTREEKIAELKRRIANKEYNVKPEAVADRMVNEHIQTRGLN